MTDEVIDRLLAEALEDERLSEMLGVDLTAPFQQSPTRVPERYLTLSEHLRRSEEMHRFLRNARRAEATRAGR